jgi:hypothetical protein
MFGPYEKFMIMFVWVCALRGGLCGNGPSSNHSSQFIWQGKLALILMMEISVEGILEFH